MAAQVGQPYRPWQFDALIGRPADDIVAAGGGIVAGGAREKHRKWRAANLEKYRANASKYYAANLEMYRAYDRKKRENLTDGYLMDKLKRCNLPVTPETIDYKRIQLKLYREIKKQQNDERD